MFPVNAIAFNRPHGTFATGGKPQQQAPIPACRGSAQQCLCRLGLRQIGYNCPQPTRACPALPCPALPRPAGGDGVINFWDGEHKKRLHQVAGYPTSVAALAFNGAATKLAVASSYTFEQVWGCGWDTHTMEGRLAWGVLPAQRWCGTACVHMRGRPACALPILR